MLHICRCKFKNGKNSGFGYGYICHDDYGKTYNNLWLMKDIVVPTKEFLKKVFEDRVNNDELLDMLEFVIQNKKTFIVDDKEMSFLILKDFMEKETFKNS